MQRVIFNLNVFLTSVVNKDYFPNAIESLKTAVEDAKQRIRVRV